MIGKLEPGANNIDTYFIKNSIALFLESQKMEISGHVIDVGCGNKPYEAFFRSLQSVEDYLGIDIENPRYQDNKNGPDQLWDGVTIPQEDQTFNTLILTEVLEHCFSPETVLKEAHRILRTGGNLVITVPFLWNLHDAPGDYYRFTHFALKKMLENTGFKVKVIHPFGGWHASLGQVLGLWLNRSGISQRKKSLLRFLIIPVIKYLYRKDRLRNKDYIPTMYPGLGLVAEKL